MDLLKLYFNYCWVLKVIEFLLFLLFFAVLLMSNNKFTSVFGFEHRVCLLFLAYCQYLQLIRIIAGYAIKVLPSRQYW